MKEEEIFASLEEILKEKCLVSTPFKTDTSLGELGLDSVAFLTLAVEIENTFRIKLQEDGPFPQNLQELSSLIRIRLDENTE